VFVLDTATLGAQFANALAKKDFDRLRGLLHPEIDFRGMTPSRFWEASDPDTVVSEVLQQWFDASDEIESLDALGDASVRRSRARRLSVLGSQSDGRFVVEQQAYVSARGGMIGWMRVMCSGFRPSP
jgi:hypothetical protein